jgi:hypothetical protein
VDGTEGYHSSAATNGFAISSLPSRGLTRTRRVPRATTRPRGRVVVLFSSSVWERGVSLCCVGLGLAEGGSRRTGKETYLA